MWALATAVAAYQKEDVVEVAKDAARQAAAMLPAQSIDIATVESTVGPFLGPYRAAVNLVASADDAAMAEAYMVGMVVPQEQRVEEVGASDDIEALFGDNDDEVVAPVTTDEQVALMASFETAHCEESMRQFMAAEREALATMLVVRANAAREAARVAAEEEAARVAARAVEAALDLAAREEAATVEEVATAEEVAHAVARAEEQAEEAAAEAAAQEEMAWDRRRWDEDMAARDVSARSMSSPPNAATAGT
jgi:hypothetical protein